MYCTFFQSKEKYFDFVHFTLQIMDILNMDAHHELLAIEELAQRNFRGILTCSTIHSANSYLQISKSTDSTAKGLTMSHLPVFHIIAYMTPTDEHEMSLIIRFITYHGKCIEEIVKPTQDEQLDLLQQLVESHLCSGIKCEVVRWNASTRHHFLIEQFEDEVIVRSSKCKFALSKSEDSLTCTNCQSKSSKWAEQTGKTIHVPQELKLVQEPSNAEPVKQEPNNESSDKVLARIKLLNLPISVTLKEDSGSESPPPASNSPQHHNNSSAVSIGINNTAPTSPLTKTKIEMWRRQYNSTRRIQKSKFQCRGCKKSYNKLSLYKGHLRDCTRFHIWRKQQAIRESHINFIKRNPEQEMQEDDHFYIDEDDYLKYYQDDYKPALPMFHETCKLCLRDFTNQLKFEEDQSKHKQQFSNLESEIECPYPGCSSIIPTKWDLNGHIRTAHPEMKEAGACCECRMLVPANMLRFHFFKKHNVRSHLCPVCGKMVMYFTQLKVSFFLLILGPLFTNFNLYLFLLSRFLFLNL